MGNIFTGMLLVFLDFNIKVGTSTIGLIPDFAGYIVMVNGLAELEGDSLYFVKAKSFARGMIVYTAVLYAMDLLGISRNIGLGAFFLGLASTVVSLYISYYIVKGVEDLEDIHGMYLSGDSLYSTWKAYAAFSVAIYILIIIPVLNLICLLGALIVAIVFLAAFNKSKNLYYSHWRK